MSRGIRLILNINLISAFLFFLSNVLAQSGIDIEWMHGYEAYSLTHVPDIQWTSKNELVITDVSEFYRSGALKIFNPVTGETRRAFDPERSIQSLKKIHDYKSPEQLPLPEVIGPNGEKALFIIDDDLFVLLFDLNIFNRITRNRTAGEASGFSPDGTKVAWVRDHDLYYYDVDTRESHRLTFDGDASLLNGVPSWIYWEEIFGRQNTAYWWSGQSDAIAYLQSDETPVDTTVLLGFESGVPEIYTQRYPLPGSPNPAVRIGFIEIGKDSTRWIDPVDEEFEYFIRARWLPDGQQLAVETLNRSQTALDLYFADRATGRIHSVLRERDRSWVNIHEDLRFLHGRKQFLWSSERTGYAHLYLFDYSGQLVRELTRGDWAVSSTGGEAEWIRNSIAWVDEGKGPVYFSSHKKSSLENHIYSVGLNGSNLQSLTESQPGDHQVTFSRDGNWYADHFSNIQSPDALTVRQTRGTKQYELVPSHTDAVSRLNLQVPVLFRIPARDGFQMPAMIYKPPGFHEGDKYPVILYVYGGPSSPVVFNKWDPNIYWHNILADHGFIVVAVDNRSATGISKDLENTIFLNSPLEETKDLIAAISWLKKQNYVDKDRIGIWGWSQGATMVMSVMTHSRDIKAGISVSGVSDWRFYDTKYAEMFMRRPDENPDGYKKNSLVESAGDIHGRILLIQGTFDKNVHPINTYAFANALVESGKLFSLQIYPDYGHSLGTIKVRNHLYHTMLDFWMNYLK